MLCGRFKWQNLSSSICMCVQEFMCGSTIWLDQNDCRQLVTSVCTQLCHESLTSMHVDHDADANADACTDHAESWQKRVTESSLVHGAGVGRVSVAAAWASTSPSAGRSGSLNRLPSPQVHGKISSNSGKVRVWECLSMN